jgi:ribonuclease P protein component
MLKKSERLSRSLFTQYFEKGKRNHGLYTTIITLPHQAFLCSVVVGKKVSKLSPKRNQIRRRIYGLVENIKQEKSLSGVFIIITKPAINTLSKADFQVKVLEEVGRVLK